MNTDSTSNPRYIQLREPAEHLPDYIVCIWGLRVVETRQVYILVDLLPADRVPELVYFPRLALLVGSLFEYGEILQRTTVGFAVIGSNANTGILEPNFCDLHHNTQILSTADRPYIVEKFRCEICSVRPFDSLARKPVLYEFAFVEQLAENFARQIRLQVAHPLFVVTERQSQRIIAKIIYIRNP